MSLAENLKPMHIHQQLHKVVSSKRWDEFEYDVVSDGFPFPVKPQSSHQALHLCIKPLQRIKYGAAWLRYTTSHLLEWLFIIWLEHPIHGVLILLLNNNLCSLRGRAAGKSSCMHGPPSAHRNVRTEPE
jgi:hypothetical protein